MNTHSQKTRSQKGVVLITALIFLIVITLFGLSSISLISQQERVAMYTYDRSLTFQAAEGALRQAESAVEALKPQPVTGSCALVVDAGNQVQVCPPPTATETRWLDSSFTGWADAEVVGTTTLAITPQYFVEYMGATFPCNFDPTSSASCKRYRITARAGGSGRASAMVQSIYATE